MTGNKNAPRAQPRAEVAPEPGHYGPEHLPEGQAVDVKFNYVIHRFDAAPVDLKTKPAFPRFWLAHDEVGISCAIRAALYPFESLYPIQKRGEKDDLYEERVAVWQMEDQSITASVEAFMVHVRDADSWDYHHSIVWTLADGGLSVTQVGGDPTPPWKEVVVEGKKG